MIFYDFDFWELQIWSFSINEPNQWSEFTASGVLSFNLIYERSHRLLGRFKLIELIIFFFHS